MQDFTLTAYSQYLRAIKISYANILCFADFFTLKHIPDSFIIIRHDIDRKPFNALKMAKLENQMGIRSTYYFRTRPHVFIPELISEIASAGHEIGYHYESLSDAKGNHQTALCDFEKNLKKLQKIAPIRTIAMHGNPISLYDNRDMWRTAENHAHLEKNLEIYGEVYLDIDYTNIAYITDTGRNWRIGKANRRDIVDSAIKPDFKNGKAVLDCFKQACFSKVIFQVHPERWSDSKMEYFSQYAKDKIANIIKTIV